MEDAYRLTFEEKGGRLTLLSLQRLAMRAPPGQPGEESAEILAGRFVELRDPGDRVLYRRGIDGELPPTIEHPTGEPSQPLARVQVKASTKRIVSILVPALKGGSSVSLIEMPPMRRDVDDEPQIPKELYRVDLFE